VATRKADNGIRLFGQQVDQLALAFVTPLGAYDNDVFAHFNP
jgi:hypothetical protein